MQIIKQGEKVEKNGIQIDREKRQVVVSHTWKPSKDSENRYLLTYRYDFSDVTDDEIWKHCAQWVNKDFQNRMRVGEWGEEEAEEQEKTAIDVKEMYSRKGRAPVDPVKAAKKAFAGLSKEQRDAILAELQG